MKSITVGLLLLVLVQGMLNAQTAPSASPAASPQPSASVPQMVKRIVDIKTIEADPSLKLDQIQIRYLTELLKSTFAADQSYVVAEGKDIPDTVLNAKLSAKDKNTFSLRAQFQDTKKPDTSFDKQYIMTSLDDSGKALSVFSAVKKDLSPLLVAIAQTVTVKIDERIETQTEIKEVAKGVSLTVVGLPGQLLTFADNSTQTVGPDGTFVLANQPQNSSVRFSASLSGYYDKVFNTSVEDKDVTVETSLDPLQRFAIGIKAGNSLKPVFMYGIWPEHLFLSFALENSLVNSSPHIHYEGQTLPVASFIQPEFGAIYYLFPPDSIFQLAGDLSLGTRFDSDGAGVWGFSQRVALDTKLNLVFELRFIRNFSIFIAGGARMFFSTTDVVALNEATMGTYDYPDYAAANVPDDPTQYVLRLGSQAGVTYDLSLGLRLWL